MVIWTKSAKNDLKAVFTFIARDSRIYAEKTISDFLTKAASLNDQPFMGRKVPEINSPRIRELQIFSYRLIYEVQDGMIYVLALIHSRQHFRRTWKNR